MHELPMESEENHGLAHAMVKRPERGTNRVGGLETKTCGQPRELALSGNSSTDRALWNLSLVLKEISESLESPGDKKEPGGCQKPVIKTGSGIKEIGNKS